jgi:uncharacterized protein YjiS (DUF1127 family)
VSAARRSGTGPQIRRVMASSFEGLVNAVQARIRAWTAQRRAAQAARVASELEALSDAQLKRLGMTRRGERS